MAVIDHSYHTLLYKIIHNGYKYKDPNRKNTYRTEIDHHVLEHNLEQDGFPAITTKNLYWKGVVGELIWFLNGDTNIKYLNDNKIYIWDKDANNFSSTGDVGRNYGAQWRKWSANKHLTSSTYIDQISTLIENLIKNPMGTRHIVTAWNPAELYQTALPPCHWSFEIICYPTLHSYGFTLKWHQRSVDTFLGLPFNIASYALLAHIIGRLTGYTPIKLIGDLSNVHIYDQHMDAVYMQLSRSVTKYKAPALLMPEWKNIERFSTSNFIETLQINDFKLIGYNSYPTIHAEMIAMKK